MLSKIENKCPLASQLIIKQNTLKIHISCIKFLNSFIIVLLIRPTLLHVFIKKSLYEQHIF